MCKSTDAATPRLVEEPNETAAPPRRDQKQTTRRPRLLGRLVQVVPRARVPARASDLSRAGDRPRGRKIVLAAAADESVSRVRAAPARLGARRHLGVGRVVTDEARHLRAVPDSSGLEFRRDFAEMFRNTPAPRGARRKYIPKAPLRFGGRPARDARVLVVAFPRPRRVIRVVDVHRLARVRARAPRRRHASRLLAPAAAGGGQPQMEPVLRGGGESPVTGACSPPADERPAGRPRPHRCARQEQSGNKALTRS